MSKLAHKNVHNNPVSTDEEATLLFKSKRKRKFPLDILEKPVKSVVKH